MLKGIVPGLILSVGAAASAAPDPGVGGSSSDPPVGTTAPHVSTYGLCSGPQNPEAFPSSPVPVVETQCEYTQKFEATAASPTAGGTCGGFTIAFGQQGDLKRKWKNLWLTAKWGDAPPTQAQCANSHLAAAAWGYRCANASCSSGAWERIGAAKKIHGTWNTTSQVCYLSIIASTGDKYYLTANLDVIATQGQGSSAVKKRAAGSIYNHTPNHKCPTATYTPRSASAAPK